MATDPKPWPLNGYAPGGYMCRCLTCEKTFEGDKRAVTCLECAVVQAKNAAPGTPTPLTDLFHEAMRQGEDTGHIQSLKARIEAREEGAKALAARAVGVGLPSEEAVARWLEPTTFEAWQSAYNYALERSSSADLATKLADHAYGKALKLARGRAGELIGMFARLGGRASFQARVEPWMRETFGDVIPFDRVERGDRLLEEVFELLQSGGYDPARVAALRDYVWSRPVGDPAQEVGGVMVTLAAYCLAFGLDMHTAGETELARVWTKVEAIRAKQAAKPTGSALPVVDGRESEGASVAAYNEVFDAAYEAGQEVFDAGWMCGWMMARYPGGWDDDAIDDFHHQDDSVARGEAWDAHREAFFKRLPLAEPPALSPTGRGEGHV